MFTPPSPVFLLYSEIWVTEPWVKLFPVQFWSNFQVPKFCNNIICNKLLYKLDVVHSKLRSSSVAHYTNFIYIYPVQNHYVTDTLNSYSSFRAHITDLNTSIIMMTMIPIMKVKLTKLTTLVTTSHTVDSLLFVGYQFSWISWEQANHEFKYQT